MDEELNKKFMVYEKQIRQIQEQLQVIEQAILDMNQISLGLDEIKGKKDLEILSPIGRGIFVKAKILSDELTVDVGEGNFVKKSIPETKEIIAEQVKKLGEMKKDLESELEKIDKDMTQTMQESEGHKHEHTHEKEDSPEHPPGHENKK